jgi:hypothetical protein
MLKFDNLEYPLFKTSILLGRLKENNRTHKDTCISELREWVDNLMGQHANYNKKFNRSV